MYNGIVRTALASIVVGFLQVPIDPPERTITMPVGPLPWDLPQLPVIDVDFGIVSVGFAEVEHTTNYDQIMADMQDAIDAGTTVTSNMTSEIDGLLGETSPIPDLSGAEDFATGIDAPGYETLSAYDVAAELGTNIGTIFSYIRAIVEHDWNLGPAGIALAFIVLCIFWMLLVSLIKFAIQFVDMLWSAILRVKQMIPFN